jgi:NADP-dependent 3-hydroxy acid dehydrogenase YdfG
MLACCFVQRFINPFTKEYNERIMADLKGKVIAVTGASSGIGQRIAETCGMAGAHVFMCGRTPDSMSESKTKIEASGGRATIQTFDITDESALRDFIRAAAEAGSGLDLMVNNAGLGHTSSTIEEDKPEHWREMLDVNVYALLVGCQEAIKVMKAKGNPGRIINISSTATINRASGVYGATKYAVNAVTSTLREELQDDDIRVTSLMPGVFASNFVRNMDPAFINGMAQALGIKLDFKAGDKLPDEMQQKITEMMSKQVGDSQALADAVVYIAEQPINIGIDEIIIRPQKNLQLG